VVADAPAQGFELVKPEPVTIDGKTYTLDAVKRPVPGEAAARVFSLDGQWIEGRVQRRGDVLEFQPPQAFASGMSGSPIINAVGAAIGVVSVDCMSLVDGLPKRIMRGIALKTRSPGPRRPSKPK
jgi:hypothetical protein